MTSARSVRSVTFRDRLGRAATATALAVAFLVALVVEAIAVAQSWGARYWLLGGTAAVVVCMLALMRRRQPAWTAVAGLSVAALTVLAARLAHLPTEPGPAMALGLSVLVGAAVRTLPPAWASGIAGGGLAVVAATHLAARPSASGAAAAVAVNGVAWLAAVAAGLALRLRDGRAQATVEKVRQEERLELARELHDVVAHHITAMLIHAQAAQLLARRDPAKLPDSLTGIEAAGSDALAAMRRVVGILRDTDDAPPSSPEPEQLSTLVERFGRQGPPVRLRVPEETRPWPPEVTGTVYRIVREALTNVSRHAPLARSVTVTVGQDPHGVTVEVVDDAPCAPVRRHAGYGLIGMGERVKTIGGTLSAGPRTEGGWCVQATLPVPADNAR
jgi:signal transduction histidine kinase